MKIEEPLARAFTRALDLLDLQLRSSFKERKFLLEEIERLREALEFYADEKNYDIPFDPHLTLIARKALEKK